MMKVAIKKLPSCASCPDKILQSHVAQMFPADIKLLERNTGGIQLVGVQEMLEPFPNLILCPVLGMYFMPLSSKKTTWCCKRRLGYISHHLSPRIIYCSWKMLITNNIMNDIISLLKHLHPTSTLRKYIKSKIKVKTTIQVKSNAIITNDRNRNRSTITN